MTLAEIAQRLGRNVLEELAVVAKPDTLLAWYRKLIANKFDGSRIRQRVGRPRIDEEAERLVVQMAKENPGWGYDRIEGVRDKRGSYGVREAQKSSNRPERMQQRRAMMSPASNQSRQAFGALASGPQRICARAVKCS